MRIRYFLILSILVGFGCKPSTKENSSTTKEPEVLIDLDFEAIKERGYIIALVDNSSTGLFIYKGKTMGYEYDLLKMFADSMGIELQIHIERNLEKAFEKLNAGEGDIMAYNLTVTKERKEKINFTHYHNLVRSVLVQRKPNNWRKLKLHQIEAALLREQVDLIGKEVWVRYKSTYFDRIINLSEEIGGEIVITESNPETETEDLIKQVADGEINYTIAEEDIALVNASYYSNIDVKTPVSFSQQIAWGVRKNSTTLLDTLNHWILKMRKHPDYNVVYNKYFKNRKSIITHKKSEYSTEGGGSLSPYDDLIKKAADTLGWDWKILAAQIFKESQFNPKSESWVGAQGLMQVMPRTAQEYGIKNLKNPKENIKAGTNHLLWLQERWDSKIADSLERVKFVLASYNVGHGHVSDARRLAEKNDEDPNNWEVIADYLVKKSKPEYYNDPVVQFGYCRGHEPVNYVSSILETYDNYTKIFDSLESSSTQ